MSNDNKQFKYSGNSLKSGVYKITNIKNGRFYVGSTKEFKRRWRQHISSLLSNKHTNAFLQADFNKCGQEVFLFEVLEIMEGSTKEERKDKEQNYLDLYFGKPYCYNLAKTAFPSVDGIRQSEQIRLAKSEIMKARWKYNIAFRKRMSGENHPFFGKPRSKEVKMAISQKNKENSHFLGKHHSAESKRKIGNGNKGKIHSLEQNRHHGEIMKGKKQSDELIKKRADMIRGFRQSDKQRLACTKANAKFYNIKLMSPQNEIFGPIINIMDFARKHGLVAQKMYQIINGKRKSHMGWKLI